MTAAKKTAPSAATKKKATMPKYLGTFRGAPDESDVKPVVRPGRHAGRPTTLATLRKGAGITQADVAERSGMSQPYVSKLEADEGLDVLLSTLRKYVEALGAELEIRVVKGEGSWRVKV